MAFLASSAVDISTNPKPRDCPVNLSVITLADSTVPCDVNSWFNCTSVVEKGRPPTYIFEPMGFLLVVDIVLEGKKREGRRRDSEAAWVRLPISFPSKTTSVKGLSVEDFITRPCAEVRTYTTRGIGN